MKRRDLLQKTVMGIGAGLVALPSIAEVVCAGITPPQVEGPFYPISEKLDTDNDLTYRKDKSLSAKGEIIYITGIISDGKCQPIEGALVEIWQACESGRYDHPSDPNPAELDPNFQYFGRAITNQKGEYLFKTIRPGSYPAAQGWIRPSHVHYKVHLKGFEELTTQMYFADDSLNSDDLILLNLPAQERQKVIVDFQSKNQEGYPVGRFDITLKKIVKPN